MPHQKFPTVLDAISILREVSWRYADDPNLRRQMEEAIAILRLQLPSYQRIIKGHRKAMVAGNRAARH